MRSYSGSDTGIDLRVIVPVLLLRTGDLVRSVEGLRILSVSSYTF